MCHNVSILPSDIKNENMHGGGQGKEFAPKKSFLQNIHEQPI